VQEILEDKHPLSYLRPSLGEIFPFLDSIRNIVCC